MPAVGTDQPMPLLAMSLLGVREAANAGPDFISEIPANCLALSVFAIETET
jgi:hypothetical protein